MSSSMMTLSRRLYCSLLRTPNAYRHFSTDHLFDSDEADSAPDPPAPDAVQEEEKFVIDRPLENGLDVGIYRVSYSYSKFNFTISDSFSHSIVLCCVRLFW